MTSSDATGTRTPSATTYQLCRILLSTVGLESLWTETGPTLAATELLCGHRTPPTREAELVLFVAAEIWDPGALYRRPSLHDLAHDLAPRTLTALAAYFVAVALDKTDADLDDRLRARRTDDPRPTPSLYLETIDLLSFIVELDQQPARRRDFQKHTKETR